MPRAVFQPGHGLRAAQAVVATANGWSIAPAGGAIDGIVVGITDKDRFTVETAGEAYLPFSTFETGATYGVGVNGTLVAGSSPGVAVATDATHLRILASGATSGGAGLSAADVQSLIDASIPATYPASAIVGLTQRIWFGA